MERDLSPGSKASKQWETFSDIPQSFFFSTTRSKNIEIWSRRCYALHITLSESRKLKSKAGAIGSFEVKLIKS